MSRFDIWDDARIAMLTELWEDGHSASAIAATMKAETHYPFTRSSIIGKAHRLNLDARPGPANITANRAKRGIMPKKPGPKRKLTDEQRRANRAAIVRAQTARKAAEPKPLLAKPKPGDKLERMNGGAVSGAYTLEQAQALNGCRWPSGHRPNMTFCGASKPATDSYCPSHRSIASTPTARQAQERA